MARLTITLSDERYLALKQAAATQRRSMREIIESSLDQCGIRIASPAERQLARARKNSGMDETEALELAVKETRSARGA